MGLDCRHPLPPLRTPIPALFPACRKSTEVLRINLRSGRLELENDATAESSYANEVRMRSGAGGRYPSALEIPSPSHCLPPSLLLALQSEALAQLHSRGFELAERGSALLGYVMAGPAAGVLLATRSKEKAVLPGGHTVYAVTDSQWIIVPLLVRNARRGGSRGLGAALPLTDRSLPQLRRHRAEREALTCVSRHFAYIP